MTESFDTWRSNVVGHSFAHFRTAHFADSRARTTPLARRDDEPRSRRSASHQPGVRYARVIRPEPHSFSVATRVRAPASLAMAPQGAPTPEQQTVVLVNTFCAQTVEMLNAVSATCERKLADASTRIRGVEAKLAVLESMLASVEGEDDAREGA